MKKRLANHFNGANIAGTGLIWFSGHGAVMMAYTSVTAHAVSHVCVCLLRRSSRV